MKNLKTMIAIAAALAANGAYADKGSGSGSHGGIVSICPDGRGGETVELADLHETKLRPGLAKMRTVERKGSVDAQIDRLYWAISYSFNPQTFGKKEIIERAKRIRQIALPSRGYRWPEATDMDFYPYEPGCITRTTVHYITANLIEYDEETLSKMSPTQQAALWAHESIFERQRQISGVMTSLPTRRMVAYLFSSYPHAELFRTMAWSYLIPETEGGRIVGKNLEISGSASELGNTWFLLGNAHVTAGGTVFKSRRQDVPGYRKKIEAVLVTKSLLGVEYPMESYREPLSLSFGGVTRGEVLRQPIELLDENGSRIYAGEIEVDQRRSSGMIFAETLELRPVFATDRDDFLAGLVR